MFGKDRIKLSVSESREIDNNNGRKEIKLCGKRRDTNR